MISPWKSLEYRNNIDTLDRGRFLVSVMVGEGGWAQESTKYENLVEIAHFGNLFAPYGRHNTLITMKLSL